MVFRENGKGKVFYDIELSPVIKGAQERQNVNLPAGGAFEGRNLGAVMNLLRREGGVNAGLTKTVFQRAWHGSPAQFDKFSNDAISSANGTTHGWGHYFAKDRAVSEGYGPKESGAHLYEVDVPENEYLLHENRTLKEQSAQVKAALAKLKITEDRIYNWRKGQWATKRELERLGKFQRDELAKTGRSHDYMLAAEMTGRDIASLYYDKATKGLPINNETLRTGHTAAAKALKRAGIKGYRYTGIDDGECFVIFDGKEARITSQLYQADTLGGIMGATTFEDNKAIIRFFKGANIDTAARSGIGRSTSLGWLLLFPAADVTNSFG